MTDDEALQQRRRGYWLKLARERAGFTFGVTNADYPQSVNTKDPPPEGRGGGVGMKRWLVLAALVAACSGTPAAQPAAPTVFVPDAPVATLAPLYGTGVITFGTGVDPDTLAVTGLKTTFKTSSKKIAWSASLSEPAGATTIKFVLASRSKTGVEQTVYKQDTDVSNPDFDTLANDADLALLVDRKAGTYVVRYLRDSTVLAEGTFTLVK